MHLIFSNNRHSRILTRPNPIKISHNTTQISHIGKNTKSLDWPSVLSGPALYAPNPIKISHTITQISHSGKKQSFWIGLRVCQGLRFKPPNQLKSRTIPLKLLISGKTKVFGLAFGFVRACALCPQPRPFLPPKAGQGSGLRL